LADKKLHLRNVKKSFGGRTVCNIENLVLGTHGIEGLIGPNGAGKTTLMSLITQKISMDEGQALYYPNDEGIDISSMTHDEIARAGIVKTNQVIQDFESLTIRESLLLSVAQAKHEKFYKIFSEDDLLREAKKDIDEYLEYFHFEDPNGYALSAGEKKLLDIIRCLLLKPKYLLMDEPTAGLPDDLTRQVMDLIKKKTQEEDMNILIIEHNLDLIWEVSERVHFMAEGQILLDGTPDEVRADQTVAAKYMGESDIQEIDAESDQGRVPEVILPDQDSTQPQLQYGSQYKPPPRWTNNVWEKTPLPSDQVSATEPTRPFDQKVEPLYKEAQQAVERFSSNEIILVGTYDTKAEELNYIRDQILQQDLRVRRVDLSTSGKPSSAEVSPNLIAAFHPGGSNAVFTGHPINSIVAMSVAFANWIKKQNDIAGIISAAGSVGTSLVSSGMQELAVGIPKVIISTVASGDVASYIGSSDIMMMHSVTDVQGLNEISKNVLSNGANAIVGMVKAKNTNKTNKSSNLPKELKRPTVGITMVGVNAVASEQITDGLKDRFDCLQFHARGAGGQSMETLVDRGLIDAVIDLTTTDIADMKMGGIYAANKDRFGAIIRSGIPYIGSVGGLDMVNFGPRDSISEQYSNRLLVEQTPQVTAMRTSVEENRLMGAWIAKRLNEMKGPVRFMIPERGLSALDQNGQPFYDQQANQALFEAISNDFEETDQRKLIRTPYHINDPGFTKAIIDSLNEINQEQRGYQYAAS